MAGLQRLHSHLLIFEHEQRATEQQLIGRVQQRLQGGDNSAVRPPACRHPRRCLLCPPLSIATRWSAISSCSPTLTTASTRSKRPTQMRGSSENEADSKQQSAAQSVENDEDAGTATLTKRQQRRKAEREQRRAEIAAMPDVWKEANVEELRRLEPTLLALALRVRTILNEYPKQEMLLQLLRIVHRLSSLPSTSPVMQLLSAEWSCCCGRRRSGTNMPAAT